VTTLLQISDPHFGTERPQVAAALTAFARRLAPDVIVLSGDITQRARRAQFATARAFVAALGPARLLAIPGNHDIPLFDVVTRLLDPYREHRRAFGGDLEPELRTADLLAICVNTTRAYRHKHGEISAAQVERVAQRLGSAEPAQLRIVVVHQPVGVERAKDADNLLRGAELAVRRWSAAGADLVLGGHIHLPYVLPLHDQLTALPRKVWAVQAGTAVSARIRHEADNSVNVVRYDSRGAAQRQASVERWDYRETRGAFELDRSHALDLDSPPREPALFRPEPLGDAGRLRTRKISRRGGPRARIVPPPYRFSRVCGHGAFILLTRTLP
jgi:3',5'-cyclic AMP phosphodiesterase CpdA